MQSHRGLQIQVLVHCWHLPSAEPISFCTCVVYSGIFLEKFGAAGSVMIKCDVIILTELTVLLSPDNQATVVCISFPQGNGFCSLKRNTMITELKRVFFVLHLN